MFIREKCHPLFYLRKFKMFQWLTRIFDLPIAVRFAQIHHPIYVSFTKNLSFLLTGGESGESKERVNFIKIVNRGKLNSFIDVGANIGLFGFLFKSLVPQGKVLMIEPDTSNYNLLQKTIAKHNIQDIVLINAVVSDVEGMVEFYIDEVSGATGSISEVKDLFVTRHHNIKPDKAIVNSVTLDGVALKYGVPDFIKIDVEGAELRVLQGAMRLLRDSRPVIFFECDSQSQDVTNLFHMNGYILFDFLSLTRTDFLCHNNLALHKEKHSDLIYQLGL